MGVEVWDPSLASFGIECLPPMENTAHTATTGNVNTFQRLPVTRCLFGYPPVNHEEVLSCVKQNLAKVQEEMKQKWNFDFINEQPINHPQNRYHWTVTNTAATIYGNSRFWEQCNNRDKNLKQNNGKVTTKLVKHHCQRSTTHTDKKKHKNTNNSSFDSSKINCNHKQLTITDFMKCTKKKFNENRVVAKYYLRSKTILVPENKIKEEDKCKATTTPKRILLRRLPKRKVTIKCR